MLLFESVLFNANVFQVVKMTFSPFQDVKPGNNYHIFSISKRSVNKVPDFQTQKRFELKE